MELRLFKNLAFDISMNQRCFAISNHNGDYKS